MRAILRLIPRPYRTGLTRVIIALVICGVLYAMLSTKPSTVGKGKSDEHRFMFDYDVKDDVYYEPAENLNQAVPPAQHRGAEFEQPGGNFTKDNMYASQPVDFYTEDELAPLFERPKVDPSAPGEYGKAYKVTDNSAEVKKLVKEGWDKHAFNHYVCQKISLHRSVGDKRDQECKVRKWRKPLPDTSVIIIFHNEAWCALLRTVHSVLENSPKILLKEIILVDDASTLSNLGKELTDYVAKLQIVKIIRLPSRAGLIRARLAGAQEAQGSVLTFLDSHCECAPHWLEPMLERIAEDNTRVVCPVIEVIDADTFAMSLTTARSVQTGILSWSLGFNWAPRKINPGQPIKNDEALTSATMAGGLFAMSRKYFYHLGSYDNDMLVWGGENIEMSLRIWMCGGSLEIHPCSHVGHVFRKRAPYSHPGGSDVITHNNKRVAEVWLDEYKEQYYKRVPRARAVEAGDLTARIKLRHDLKCRNFQWYITNIYPALYATPKEDILKGGEWHNKDRDSKYCLDSANPDGKVGVKMTMYVCHGMGVNQDFDLTRNGEIRHSYSKELCLQPSGNSIVTYDCVFPKKAVPPEQKWLLTQDGHFRHLASMKCMAAVGNSVLLEECEDVPAQMWFVKSLHKT